MRRRRAAAAGRAARGLHGAQSGSSAPTGGAAGRAGSAGIRLPVRCGVQRRHGLLFRRVRPAAAAGGKRRCGAGAAGYFQRAAFGRASGPPLAGLDARLRPRRGVRRGCGGVRRQTGVFPHGRHARPGRAVRAAVRSGPGRAGRDGGGEPFLSGRACDAGHRGAVRARCVCTAERAAGRGRAPRAAARAGHCGQRVCTPCARATSAGTWARARAA